LVHLDGFITKKKTNIQSGPKKVYTLHPYIDE
jgi:hypothetical protein